MPRRMMSNGAAIPMDPGERDRAVIIQQATASTGNSGFPATTWTTLVSPVWMRRIDLRGSERYRADQLSAPSDAQWEMGYREDMDPELVDVKKARRLVYQGRIYDITEGTLIGRREGIELMTLTGQQEVSS